MRRRNYLKATSAASGGVLAVFAGCAGNGGQSTPTPRVERETVVRERTVVQERTASNEDLTSLHTIEPEGTLDIPTTLYAIGDGVWRRRGIDLSMEAAALGKFNRQVSADLAQIGAPGIATTARLANEGEDVVLAGMHQDNFINALLARTDSDISDPTDLSGMDIGVPFLSSVATHGVRAIIIDDLGFDILDEAGEIREAPPPVLWNYLNDGEVDAIIEFTGFVLAGEASDDVEVIYQPFDYWSEKMGSPPAVASYSVKPSWIEDNADVAVSFFEGWEAAINLVKENTSEAVTNYGRLGGITTEAEAEVFASWLEEDKVYPSDPRFDDELIDNHWEFLNLMMEEAGAFEELPDKEDFFISWAELQDLAEDS